MPTEDKHQCLHHGSTVDHKLQANFDPLNQVQRTGVFLSNILQYYPSFGLTLRIAQQPDTVFKDILSIKVAVHR